MIFRSKLQKKLFERTSWNQNVYLGCTCLPLLLPTFWFLMWRSGSVLERGSNVIKANNYDNKIINWGNSVFILRAHFSVWFHVSQSSQSTSCSCETSVKCLLLNVVFNSNNVWGNVGKWFHSWNSNSERQITVNWLSLYHKPIWAYHRFISLFICQLMHDKCQSRASLNCLETVSPLHGLFTREHLQVCHAGKCPALCTLYS